MCTMTCGQCGREFARLDGSDGLLAHYQADHTANATERRVIGKARRTVRRSGVEGLPELELEQLAPEPTEAGWRAARRPASYRAVRRLAGS